MPEPRKPRQAGSAERAPQPVDQPQPRDVRLASGHPKNSQIASYWSAFGGRSPSSTATYSRRVMPSRASRPRRRWESWTVRPPARYAGDPHRVEGRKSLIPLSSSS